MSPSSAFASSGAARKVATPTALADNARNLMGLTVGGRPDAQMNFRRRGDVWIRAVSRSESRQQASTAADILIQ
jgi:hypothetical protein